MPTTNNSDSVAVSISSRLHKFTKSGAPWIVTLSSSAFYKNLEFSFILNCTVPSLMLFYSLMQSHVVSKGKICELLSHYRRGRSLQNSFRLTIHYHAIYYWNVSLGLRMCLYRALILKLIWCNWLCHIVLDSVHFGLKCRVIICLDNWFMNARPQVPPNIYPNKRSLLGSSLWFMYYIQLHQYILHVELINSVVSF